MMDIITTLLLDVLLLGGLGFCIFGRNSRVFKTRALLYLKYILAKLFMTMLPLKGRIWILRSLYTLIYKRNHVIQVLYLIALTLFYIIYFVSVKPLLEKYEPNQNRWLWPLTMLVVNLYAFYMASTVDPGHITDKTLNKYMDLYDYDGILFEKEFICKTCNVSKPARSKHCTKCNACSIRFDHHCLFINNCVGLFNMRYFILFLTSLTAAGFTLTLWTYTGLSSFSQSINLFNSTYTEDDGVEHTVTFLMAADYLKMRFPYVCISFIAGLSVAVMLGSFSAFHIFMALTNTNTNELYKRFTVRHGKCNNPFYKSVFQNIYEVIAPNSFIQSVLKDK